MNAIVSEPLPPPTTRKERGLEIADELVLERIPVVATFEETNAILRLSRASANRMVRLGTYPVPEMLPRLDERRRYAGEDILAEIRRRAKYGREPRRRTR